MAQTRVSCPRCRQPILADLNQLYDVNQDPEAKQKILTGAYNLIRCAACGYEGNYSTPLVYHDPEKELLLTYFPPELGLPMKEQERIIGPMITQVTNRLPMEKRKAYLLRPQQMLTMQTMIERILEGDGITREMIQAQQMRVNLLQRLMGASEDARAEIARQEEKLLDESFFQILTRLINGSLEAGDEQSARALAALQNKLLPLSEVGRKLQAQTREMEAAVKTLQEASQKGLTRESLLDLIVEAPNDIRLTAYVSMARQGMDYAFFEVLTRRIEKARGEEQARLSELRTKLLSMTDELDKEMKKRLDEAQGLLDEILQSSDITAATEQHLPEISEMFIEVLRADLQNTRQKNDLARLDKLQQVVGVIQQASKPPRELELLQELLDTPDDNALEELITAYEDEITPEFMQFVGGVMAEAQSAKTEDQDPQTAERLQAVYRVLLRRSMQANLDAN